MNPAFQKNNNVYSNTNPPHFEISFKILDAIFL